MRNRWITVGLIIVFGILLVACGGQSGTENNKSDLERIKEEGIIRVACEGTYPPFNYFDENNELTGFDVEIAKELGKRLGVEVEFVTTTWDGIIAGLNAKKYDMIVASMAITEKRAEAVDFSIPYYRSGGYLVVHEDNGTINGIDDLKGKVVGASIGSTYHDRAEQIEGLKEVKTYTSDQEAIDDLVTGRVDAVITDRIVGLFARMKGKPVKLVGDMLWEERMGIAFRKDSDELREAVNEALNQMFEDGTYERISMKWFGADIR